MAQAGEKAGEAAEGAKKFASEFWGELKNQAGVKPKQQFEMRCMRS